MNSGRSDIAMQICNFVFLSLIYYVACVRLLRLFNILCFPSASLIGLFYSDLGFSSEIGNFLLTSSTIYVVTFRNTYSPSFRWHLSFQSHINKYKLQSSRSYLVVQFWYTSHQCPRSSKIFKKQTLKSEKLEKNNDLR